MELLRVAGAQINPTVGDLEGNIDRITEAMAWAEELGADVLLLPELAVCGYPPEDLVLRRDFVEDNRAALAQLARSAGSTVTVVGFVDRVRESQRDFSDAVERRVANAAALLREGEVRGIYHKVLLPNYGVFDEERYFVPGEDPGRVWDINGTAVGVSICEDIWVPEGPPAEQAAAGAQILLNINASPYHTGKRELRLELLRAHATSAGVPVVYLNQVGGQDELVFDGASLVLDGKGEIVSRSRTFEEDRFVVDVSVPQRPRFREALPLPGRRRARRPRLPPPVAEPDLAEEGEIYLALVTGLRDYVIKNGFERVVVGLSGGIDSALTAVIAADALGPGAVWGLAMPSRFSSEASVSD
ncbi:MAG TPA: nitrilase-related carbon-nitrogen hydrolase, partial [Acidimicrobiia bacterium]